MLRNLIVLVLLAGCSSTQEETSDPASTCLEEIPWDSNSPAFIETGDTWGLDQIQATGIRLSAVDFDGDGWTDLAVRKKNMADDFSNPADRQTWLLRNTGTGTFEDITEESGIRTSRILATPRPGATWVFGDVNNDNKMDVYTGMADSGNSIAETSEMMLNTGDGHFTLGPANNAIRLDANDMPYGASFTDVDLDGNLDLWTTQYSGGSGPQQDRLYLGNGTGTFEDATQSSGLTTEPWISYLSLNQGRAHSNAWAATSCDLNNDGYPELLASSYGRAPNHLWLNNGSGQFTNIGVSSGYAFDARTDWSDNESARCWCKWHRTDEGCADVPDPSLIRCDSDADAFRWNHSNDREPFRLGGNSGATICADINNDGAMDLLTTEIVHWDVGESSDPSEILWNTKEETPRFERPGNTTTGLTRTHNITDWNDGDITASVFDFDNDSWPDIYIGSTDYPGTRGLLYRQTNPKLFSPVPIEVGIDHRRSHGSAIADFDRDGDLDIIVGHSSARCSGECYENFGIRFFENQLGNHNNWIQVSLQGTTANRSAIGARVSVEANSVTQTHEVGGGQGQWGNQDDLVQHFGLGAACSATVTIRWPDAALSQETYHLESGHKYQLIQGQEPVVMP